MVVEEVFEDIIYPNLKEYVETNNAYGARVTKAYPETSKVFPIIPVKLLPVTNKYNNFSYGEETYTFGIEIEVFAIDKAEGLEKVSKKTICDELVKLIVNYIKENYHLTIRVTHDVPNQDTNVYRNLIRLSGTLDTKYEGRLFIYPWSL
jgi:hypothetical protein